MPRTVRVIGHQTFLSSAIVGVVSVSSEQLVDSDGNRANGAWISVYATTGAIRYRDDGTSPTVSQGLRIPSGIPPFLFTGNLNKLRFIAEVPGAPQMDIQYVQYVPD